MNSFDVIIVGAGSAGCVLANRLTEDPERKVLLLEAGPDYQEFDLLPQDIKNGLKPTYSHDWGYEGISGERGRTIPLRRARLTGGCSATNASIALRGNPSDYNGWNYSGLKGWSYNDILPYFRKLEHDYDFQNEWHGQNGPIGISRCATDEMNLIQKTHLRFWLSKGYPFREDFNGPETEGVGPAPSNCIDGIRQSTSLTYLAKARNRLNLKIKSNTPTDKLIFESNRAIAVKTIHGDKYHADKIILSAGTYGSPAILMRSGIGNGTLLKSLGIKVVLDLQHVGENLQEHPLIGFHFSANPQIADNNQALVQTILMMRSSEKMLEPDIQLMIRSVYESAKSPTGADTVMFASLMKPFSRGQLVINSEDANIPPSINMGYFSDPEDLNKLLIGVKKILDLVTCKEFSQIVIDPLNFDPSALKNDDDIFEFIKKKVETYHHPVGTCSMGSVVNNEGKVYGAEGVYIVDASIMPSIPSANTNIPVIMTAEKIADTLLRS